MKGLDDKGAADAGCELVAGAKDVIAGVAGQGDPEGAAQAGQGGASGTSVERSHGAGREVEIGTGVGRGGAAGEAEEPA